MENKRGVQGNSGKNYKVLITHPDIPEKALNMLREKGYDLKISKNAEGSNAPSRDIIMRDIQGMDAVMWFGHVHVDEPMIDAAGNQLKIIGSMGAGYDHISVGLLYIRHIKVSNTPNILSSAVADMAIGLALAVSRNIVKGVDAVKKGNWISSHPSWMCGPTFEEATVGIIGLGAIGSKIVQRVKAFDVKEVLYYNREKKPADKENGANYVTLNELLERSDFVFLTVPSTKDTKHLMAKEKFEKMKNTAILINSARGDVVNQKDLIDAIKGNQIGGAGLDVTDPEPLPKDHELLTFDNVVVTPHISSATYFAREKMAVLAAQNIINVLEGGEPQTPIPKPKEDKAFKEKVLISHAAIPQEAQDVLKDKYELVVVKSDPNPTRAQLLEAIRGCAGALWYGHVRVDKEMIDAAGDGLKVVAHSGAGVDHMDVALMKQRGILVSNAAGVLGPAVAELSIALLLEVSRRTLEGYKAILADKWLMNHPTWMVGQGLSNKTIGILGLGQNGFAIAKRMIGFEIAKILYNDLEELKDKAETINGEFVSKEVLFRESDVLFLCVPLTNLTKHLINKETLRTMKNSSILINTARGEVVKQEDLIEALEKKVIWGAGLDVMYPEPLPPDHPLTKLDNCVLSPHIGSRTREARNRMFVLAAQNVHNALSGQPLITPV